MSLPRESGLRKRLDERLTSCMGKWLVRVIARRMRWLLEKNNVFHECQAGFREGRGVADQLLRLSYSVYEFPEEGEVWIHAV